MTEKKNPVNTGNLPLGGKLRHSMARIILFCGLSLLLIFFLVQCAFWPLERFVNRLVKFQI